MALEARRVRTVRIYYESCEERDSKKEEGEGEERTRSRVVKERLLCNVLIFNDLERNSLRSTYLLNGVV